ncbi:hypothetical protein ASPZODRAFT_141770 [Penicilliopsis zonata CBS 506.65]|uniref:Uncharacterized protein n=1 Tax=Penicilliopsis zonata CBS 506.65 TaxID=1073090 RepID=A0A1L9SIU3_9EURO|nr:hypothetical protein ASPZODRAFT_141770 [Penicilliopsis zonata CBS 506.65]OJJ47003.1 hypothetical protein ASPZODRAFT_141770 [Penicilliopsis zonata CBS 506.65]
MSADEAERPLFKSHKPLPRKRDMENVETIQIYTTEVLVTAPTLPLTPPGAATVTDKEQNGVEREPRALGQHAQPVGMLTPILSQSPPTPDSTPPRAGSGKRPMLAHVMYPSASSKAESFRTAKEMLSDEETDHTATPGRTVTPTRRSRQNKDNLEETPKPEKRVDCKTAQMSLHSPVHSQQSLDNGSPEYTESHRQRTLRDRVQDGQVAPATPFVKQFGEQIGWPSESAGAGVDPEESLAARRLSNVSTSSTVEVMIIDSPPAAVRTLRHSEKRSSLRSASSPITRSERTSAVSSMRRRESPPRLAHKARRISNEDRKSVISGTSSSVKHPSIASNPQVDVIPVVVIPERNSSLNWSSDGSREQSGVTLRLTPPQSKKKRTMSDSGTTTTTTAAAAATDSSRGRGRTRPVIPPRGSSLSAPTSRNNSRTTSLTSESLRSHTLAMDRIQTQLHNQMQIQMQTELKLPPEATAAETSARVHSIVIGFDETSTHLRPPSMPFTQVSIQSSSPGPVEISEATAVSLFPHNNRSLLLIEQRMPSDPRVTVSVNVAPSHPPVTPEMHSQGVQTDAVDSPLLNPRPPPSPPRSTNDRQGEDAPSTTEPGRMGSNDTTVRPSRRFGSVRLALGAHRRSNSSGSFPRTLSMRSVKNRTSGKEMDSRQHPFWRPRAFWEGMASPDTPEHAHSEDTDRDRDRDLVINNSLGMPQRRMVFQGPTIRNLKQGHGTAQLSSTHVDIIRRGSPALQHGQKHSPSHSRGLHVFSLWSLQARHLRRRLRLARQQRAERKREARRQELKQQIGEVIPREILQW